MFNFDPMTRKGRKLQGLGFGFPSFLAKSREMPRPLRHFRPDHLHEATLRGFQGRAFFVPGKRINQLIVGALAYGQKKYGMKICCPVQMHLRYTREDRVEASVTLELL